MLKNRIIPCTCCTYRVGSKARQPLISHLWVHLRQLAEVAQASATHGGCYAIDRFHLPRIHAAAHDEHLLVRSVWFIFLACEDISLNQDCPEAVKVRPAHERYTMCSRQLVCDACVRRRNHAHASMHAEDFVDHVSRQVLTRPIKPPVLSRLS